MVGFWIWISENQHDVLKDKLLLINDDVSVFLQRDDGHKSTKCKFHYVTRWIISHSIWKLKQEDEVMTQESHSGSPCNPPRRHLHLHPGTFTHLRGALVRSTWNWALRENPEPQTTRQITGSRANVRRKEIRRRFGLHVEGPETNQFPLRLKELNSIHRCRNAEHKLSSVVKWKIKSCSFTLEILNTDISAVTTSLKYCDTS